MQGLIKFSIMAVMISAVLVISGCVVYPAHSSAGYGPPPHAPAHGYRYNYQGHDVVYDSNLGVYIVVGLQDYYFYDNNYYRYSNNRWYYSRDLDRDWRDYDDKRLPPGLAKRYGHGKNDRDDYRSDRDNYNRSYRDN